MLSLAIKLEDAFRKIRYQSQTAIEKREATVSMDAEGLTDVESPIALRSRLQSPQITKIRLDQHQKLFVELFDLLALSYSMRSNIIVDNLEVLKLKYDEVTTAANKLVAIAQARKQGISKTYEASLDESRDKHEAVIWSGLGEIDAFESEVNDAVAALKKELVDILSIKS